METCLFKEHAIDHCVTLAFLHSAGVNRHWCYTLMWFLSQKIHTHIITKDSVFISWENRVVLIVVVRLVHCSTIQNLFRCVILSWHYVILYKLSFDRGLKPHFNLNSVVVLCAPQKITLVEVDLREWYES
jgi:hypothetical protein